MSDQLFLFNLIDGLPGGQVAVAPVAIAPKPAPPRPILKTPAAQPRPAIAAAPVWQGDLKLLDMVVILPFKDKDGNDRGAHLKEPGVIVGFNEKAQMVRIDVGIPGLAYEASPWRVVKMDG